MPPTVTAADSKIASARAFVRSLNILLKFMRLYGFDHKRTAVQFETAWNELRAAVPEGADSGLLLGTSGGQLLVDGAPLEATPPERSFAQLLSAAGVASIHFSPHVTLEDLSRLVRAFPAGNTKSSVLADQLKTALTDCAGIKINEVRFVAEDASLGEAKMAATLTAKALGADADQFKAWLNDPQKLLELIAAAEGAHAGSGAEPGGAGAGAPSGVPDSAGKGVASADPATPAVASLPVTPGAMTGAPASPSPSAVGIGPGEEEVTHILRLLAKLGKTAGQGTGGLPGAFQADLAQLPQRAQITLREALASIAAQAGGRRPDQSVLVKLAEHLAIRFALERYERGEVRVNVVRQMLDRMNQEIEALRKVLSSHEDQLAKAGVVVESHAELLDRQFWAAVPESGKRSVLLSPEAWCIPARNVRYYLDQLAERGDSDLARKILLNYACCISVSEAEARRRTAIGIGDLADLYASGKPQLLIEAIRQAGAALTSERDAELQTMISAAFVRLSQEAAARRFYGAVHQVIASLDSIENQRPAAAQTLRSRIGLENRIPEFVEQALRSPDIPPGLADVLRLMLLPSTDHINSRFARCAFRDDANRLVELARHLGDATVTHLREVLRAGPVHEAVDTIALLSRLDAPALERYLPSRLESWPRAAHDRVVRQLAAGGAPGRGHLLLELFDVLDPHVMPLVLDEIGMSGETACIERLARFAAGAVPEEAGALLRIKAIEALGRLRARPAVTVLRAILEERKLLGWAQPEELRIVAAEALEKMDPDWMRSFLPKSGLDPAELALGPLDADPNSTRIRQRRYPRTRLAERIPATCHTEKEVAHLELLDLSLGGGIAQTDRHLVPGTQATLRIHSGWHDVAGRHSFKASVVMRDSRAQIVAFEFIAMDFADRLKLRRFLSSLASARESKSPAVSVTPRASD